MLLLMAENRDTHTHARRVYAFLCVLLSWTKRMDGTQNGGKTLKRTKDNHRKGVFWGCSKVGMDVGDRGRPRTSRKQAKQGGEQVGMDEITTNGEWRMEDGEWRMERDESWVDNWAVRIGQTKIEEKRLAHRTRARARQRKKKVDTANSQPARKEGTARVG